MASSFANQIPVIIHVIQSLRPNSILDVGKGFGKYGFLIHEYCGINTSRKPNYKQALKEQSLVRIDAVDVNMDYSFSHLDHFYDNVFIRDITCNYEDINGYDLILMSDVIEHLNKDDALRVLKYFLDQNSKILISTPYRFFTQELYGSKAERHVSHWTHKDFKILRCFVTSQNVKPGRIFLLSPFTVKIRGFGNSLIHRIRRLGRAIKNEFG